MHDVERKYILSRLEKRIQPTFLAQSNYKRGLKDAIMVISKSEYRKFPNDKMSRSEYLRIMSELTGLTYTYDSTKDLNRAAYTNGIRSAKRVITNAYTTPISDIKKEVGI